MSYTFGAGTGDDANCTSMTSFAATATTGFVCGWWYPTTLTATRGLWSAGNTIGAEIDATTSELRLRTDNTTDGQWTTTGAGLATNTWRFLAFLVSCNNTGPAGAWRVWSGTIDSAPVECTITNTTAPVGNFTSGTTWYAGNKGTGTLAFQGDIGWLAWINDNATHDKTQNVFPVATKGTITQAEADDIFNKFVCPMWRGEVFPSGAINQGGKAGLLLMNFDGVLPVGRMHHTSGTASPVAIGINGATPSGNRSPIAMRSQTLYPSVRAH